MIRLNHDKTAKCFFLKRSLVILGLNLGPSRIERTESVSFQYKEETCKSGISDEEETKKGHMFYKDYMGGKPYAFNFLKLRD